MEAPPARSSPEQASAAHQLGLQYLRAGDAARALPELERAVELEPVNPEFLKDRGNARKTLGELDAAADSYRRALEIAPDYTTARYNLGLTLRELGRPEEAAAQFRRIHEQDPRDVDALFNLADLLSAHSRFDEAARFYRAASELAPDNPYLWLGFAIALRNIPGRLDESLRCLQRCVEIMPELAEAQYLIGNELLNEGRRDEAAAHYRKAIGADPGHAQSHTNLGNALLQLGRLDQAIDCYREAIRLDPGLAQAHLNLGSAYGLKGAQDEARESYDHALRLQPDNAAARGCLLFEMQRICDWSRLDELAALQRRSVTTEPEHDVAPFQMLTIPSTPQEQLQCARNYAAHRAGAVARGRDRLRFQFDRKPRPRLRIGYLSADFREHPGAHLIAELIELHDRTRFEIVAYSYGPDDRSSIRERLKQAFDRFVDLSSLPHPDAATRIHRDGADILVDLTGYTTYSRPEILALRPAPIQVSFLGYPGTLGADFADYLISDRFITPPGRSDGYSEQLVRMPGSYQVNDRQRQVAEAPARRELGLPEDAFVFCCFNQTVKILPQVFETWMRLLNPLPRSVLWLVETGQRATENLRREARARGVSEERLVFAPRVPYFRHLARMRAADLFLDTHPYNAHTTASDALWAGLPVLTCAGDTFASRVGGSLLTAVGLPELITDSLERYEALAQRLAREPAELKAVRDKLARNRRSAPLFATPAYARNLEEAYLQMWGIYLAGGKPHAIDL